MKLNICIILCYCSLYAVATTHCAEKTNTVEETVPEEGILGIVLEILLDRFDDMERKLLELQFELSSHREEVKNNRVSSENSIKSLEQDVRRDLSWVREKIFIHILKQNQSSYRTLEQTLLSFKSRIRGCVTTTPAASQLDTITPATPTTSETEITTSSTQPTITEPSIYASCKDAPVNASGVYLVSVNNASAPLKVYCEMEKFDGGWIVLQHRFDGSVDFYRNWAEYRDGFGELDSEFWLGLEHMHQLTAARAYEVVFEMKHFEDSYAYARYNAFKVGSASEKYILKSLGSYHGTAGDSMTAYSKGSKFSTKDEDNDTNEKHHLAQFFESGWWYGEDNKSNFNGPYKYGSKNRAIWWYDFKYGIQLSFTRMMIREL